MEIKVIQQDITKYKCDAVIVNLFEGVKIPGGASGVEPPASQPSPAAGPATAK